jgi:hypothetical protein
MPMISAAYPQDDHLVHRSQYRFLNLHGPLHGGLWTENYACLRQPALSEIVRQKRTFHLLFPPVISRASDSSAANTRQRMHKEYAGCGEGTPVEGLRTLNRARSAGPLFENLLPARVAIERF